MTDRPDRSPQPSADRRRVLAACLAVLCLDLVRARPQLAPAPAVGSAARGGTPVSGPVAGLVGYRLDVGSIKPGAPGTVRVGTVTPPSPRADILFVHGHADRLDNHARLFGAWAAAGYRVIAFDLPSHGLTEVQPIDVWTFDDLYALIKLVERVTLADADRPLLLAGWSFGGLLVTRLAQTPAALRAFTRPVRGLILLAPAIDVYPFVGGDGIARQATLNHVPYAPVAGPPHPVAPALDPLFAVRLLAEAAASRHALVPADLPTLVIAADDTADLYVKEQSLVQWSRRQARHDSRIEIYQCPGARHALDNEPYPLGPAVSLRTVAFADAVVGSTGPSVPSSPDPLVDGACVRR